MPLQAGIWRLRAWLERQLALLVQRLGRTGLARQAQRLASSASGSSGLVGQSPHRCCSLPTTPKKACAHHPAACPAPQLSPRPAPIIRRRWPAVWFPLGSATSAPACQRPTAHAPPPLKHPADATGERTPGADLLRCKSWSAAAHQPNAGPTAAACEPLNRPREAPHQTRCIAARAASAALESAGSAVEPSGLKKSAALDCHQLTSNPWAATQPLLLASNPANEPGHRWDHCGARGRAVGAAQD